MWEDVKTYSFVQNASSGGRIYTTNGKFIVYSDAKQPIKGKLTNVELENGASGTGIGIVQANGSVFLCFSGTTLQQLGAITAASGTNMKRYYPMATACDGNGVQIESGSRFFAVPVYLDGRQLAIIGSGLGSDTMAVGIHIKNVMLTWI